MDANYLYNRVEKRFESRSADAMLHVRFQGQSRNIALDILDVTQASSDQAVIQAVAAFLDVDVKAFRSMVIERLENGNMTMRPQAVFG